MSALLSLSSVTLAVGDQTPATNSPVLKYVDWKRSIPGIPVQNPRSFGQILQPGEVWTVFNGSRTTTIDGTTAFTLTQSPLGGGRYRFTATAGTLSGLRTPRSVVVVSTSLVLTVGANGLLTMASSGTPFGAVVGGDNCFIPGLTTGDPSIGFSSINEGLWAVVWASSSTLILRRLDQTISGVTETVTPTGNPLFFGVSGVQVGDKVEISAAFSASNLKNFTVAAVTDHWFEVVSTSPLVPEVALPGAAGMVFYTMAKRLVKVESDQECSVRINGDTGDTNRLAPWVAGDCTQVGEYLKTGPTWSLVVVNRAAVPANLLVVSAE